MSLKSYIILLILILAEISFSAPIDEKMKEANGLYQQSSFSQAIDLYEEIVAQEYESASLYYNLGNAYYRIGQLGKAILNYEKGLKIDPDDEDLMYNLRIAQAHTVDKIKEVPQVGLVEAWVSVLTSLSIGGWAIAVILFYLLLIFAIGLYLLSRSVRLQRVVFFFGIFNIFVLAVLVFMLVARINRETSTDFGIITAETVTVKISPNEKSEDAFVIHEGLKFAIEDELRTTNETGNQEWTKIKLSDGKVGWLPAAVYRVI